MIRRFKKLSVPEKNKIIELLNENLSLRAVGKMIGVSAKTVLYTKRLYEETGACKRRPGSGKFNPLTKVSADENQALIDLSSANPFMSARELRDKLRLNISISQTKHRLRKHGLKGYIASRKVGLTASHAKTRLEFAKTYLEFPFIEKPIVYLDERTWYHTRSTRTYVRRKKGARYDFKYTQPTYRSGRVGLNTIAAISSRGVFPLVFPFDDSAVKSKVPPLSKQSFLRYFRTRFMTWAERIFPEFEKIYILFDNAGIHNLAKEYLAQDDNFALIEYPARFPEGQPLEGIFALCARKLNKYPVTKNRYVLRQNIIDVWKTITPSLCRKYISSINKRLQLVIDAGGYSIRY